MLHTIKLNIFFWYYVHKNLKNIYWYHQPIIKEIMNLHANDDYLLFLHLYNVHKKFALLIGKTTDIKLVQTRLFISPWIFCPDLFSYIQCQFLHIFRSVQSEYLVMHLVEILSVIKINFISNILKIICKLFKLINI